MNGIGYKNCQKSCQTDGGDTKWDYESKNGLPEQRMTKIFYDFSGSADSEQQNFLMTKVQLAELREHDRRQSQSLYKARRWIMKFEKSYQFGIEFVKTLFYFYFTINLLVKADE